MTSVAETEFIALDAFNMGSNLASPIKRKLLNIKK